MKQKERGKSSRFVPRGVIRHYHGPEVLVPIIPILAHKVRDHAQNRPIASFDHPVAPRSVGRRASFLNIPKLTKTLHKLGIKLRTLVRMDTLGRPIATEVIADKYGRNMRGRMAL
jgi:hypothetical protein